jgi:glycerate-2-kinase
MLIKNFDQLVSNGHTPELQKKRKDALEILAAAVKAVDPYRVVQLVFHQNHLLLGSETVDLSLFDRVFAVGFGKASVPMVHAVCDAVSVTEGVAITNDPFATVPHQSIEVIVGGHPLPNEGSIQGTEKILNLLERCGETDCVIVVISGGGSSLLCKPLIPLVDLRMTMDLLLRSGADINDVNTIRKHLSTVKGGKLVQYTKATVISLIISDIVHDPISSIASGPTSPDTTTFSEAKAILTRYTLWDRVPESVRKIIDEGIAGLLPETPKKGNPVFHSVHNFIVANNQLACRQAVKKARELGYTSVLVTTAITGDARNVGQCLLKRATKSLSQKNTVFVSGGEPTVTVRGHGQGGRNQELVLSCVKEIAGAHIVIASMGTDGIDGSSPAAGALADGGTLSRAQNKQLDPLIFLKNNDSYTFFSALHDEILTGPTGTNVMDIQLILQ